MLYYFVGQRNDSDTNLNWLGYGSKDVKDTFNEVFVYNYTSLQVLGGQAMIEQVFMENLGHCLMVSNISNVLRVKLCNKIIFIYNNLL